VVFTQPNGQRKQRPALVILDTGDDDIVLAPITSKERKETGDCQIENWKEANLLVPSWVRLSKITCLKKEDIDRKLGSLSSNDKENIVSAWNHLYKLK
jgi:mRNA interferase MazF